MAGASRLGATERAMSTASTRTITAAFRTPIRGEPEKERALQVEVPTAIVHGNQRAPTSLGAIAFEVITVPAIPREPYILVHQGEVSFFRSCDALARYIEAPDLEGARAFDRDARVIVLSAPPLQRRFGFVSIPPVTATMTDQIETDELREALRNYVVDRAGLPDDALQEESLEELINRSLSIARYLP